MSEPTLTDQERSDLMARLPRGRENTYRRPLIECKLRERSLWEPGDVYDLGDEVIHTPRKVVTLTGFSWLWAKLTGKPTEWVEEGKPQIYRCVR